VRRIAQLAAFILAGLALAWIFNVDAAALPHSTSYHLAAYLLLAIGLYGATYGIDMQQARHDKRIIFSAVTIGVIVKALIIGGSLALAWQNPLFLILGVAVAQIDPLSVAALMGDRRMSIRARTVLAAWSSFDDPVTVILAIYAAAIAVSFGLGNDTAASASTNPLLHYTFDLAGNLALALAAWLLWKLIGPRAWLQYAALICFAAAATYTGWMLAIALIGLFARPSALENLIPRITGWAMYAAATALGVLLIGGFNLAAGLSLGAVAFIAQAIVAWPLTRGMPRNDRFHLAAAQQHGITAIILGLTLQIQFDGVVAIIAPTIITANLIHLLINHLLDRKLPQHPVVPALGQSTDAAAAIPDQQPAEPQSVTGTTATAEPE
jgi:NhaP-type Na+/H+ or K+/H+ antiporter